ncbi:heme-binding protein [Streptomyces sp. NBC_01622]|uniref:GlcG/HbpS family heme-binding protein n=1 Tax=Streptomyces sp. NBC_01622 TaxID=2975903 RepID=UPI00386AAF59|nr:heme-binding protein [Streptomyces sp. NBC_01622]
MTTLPTTHVQQIPSITNALARDIVTAAIEAAERTPHRFSIAVVDAAGHLNAFARMDGAPLLTIQIAQDKAYTAAGFGMATDQWHEFIKDDAPLAMGAPAGIDRLVTFGGGIPVTVDGRIVGGVGVSGGHWSDDIEIARAGLAVV